MRSIFLNLNSQFESSQLFKVPKLPPIILVKINNFNVPYISFQPAIPKEKFLPKIKSIPSIKKLEIGIITIIATKKDAISRGFKLLNLFFNCLVKFFKN